MIISITVVVILTSVIITAIVIFHLRRHCHYNDERLTCTTVFCVKMALFQSCGVCVSTLKESNLPKQPRYSTLQFAAEDLIRVRNWAVHTEEKDIRSKNSSKSPHMEGLLIFEDLSYTQIEQGS